MFDDYCYPNLRVLINKLNIHNDKEFDKIEQRSYSKNLPLLFLKRQFLLIGYSHYGGNLVFYKASVIIILDKRRIFGYQEKV